MGDPKRRIGISQRAKRKPQLFSLRGVKSARREDGSSGENDKNQLADAS